MKSLLALVLLCAATINLQAQSPTFEETVNYIINNIKGRVMYPGDLDAYNRVEGYRLDDVKIERNGKIELITNQQNKSYGYKNNFSIIFNIFDLVEKVDYPDGIRAHKFLVHFNGLNVSSGYGITFATDADAQKVARALRHLKTLCVKDDDLFSKIPAEEKKPKLSREETIEYINNLLSTLESIQKKVDITYSTKAIRKYEVTFSYPEKSLLYDYNLKRYTFTHKEAARDFVKDNDGGCCSFSSEYFLGNITVPFQAKDISEINEDGEGLKNTLGEDVDKYYHPVYGHNTKYNIYYSYFRVKTSDGGGVIIRYNSYDPKFTSRLKNAFLRLKELDKDNVDPFDD